MEETATLAFAVGIYLLTEDIFCLSCGVVGHDTTRPQAVGLPLPIEMMLDGRNGANSGPCDVVYHS